MLKARAVYEDCKQALDYLENELDENRWRLLFAASVTLLRTIGDVLQKVDGPAFGAEDAIRSQYNRWKSDSFDRLMFEQFIKNGRDMLVHRYETSAYTDGAIGLAVSSADDDVVELRVVEGNVYNPMSDDPWDGEDFRDVYRQSLDWWDNQLSEIEGEIEMSESRST